MKCPNCQHENRPTARFCARCRTKLQRLCPECGAEIGPEDLFCDACGVDLAGAPAPAEPAKSKTLEEQFTSFQQALPESLRQHLLTPSEGENRIVTVLFADMSSSVRRTADLHPEEAADLVSTLLKAMVDVLLKYEGRVDRFLGDGLLAVFGAPRAHESDPERAVLAAMEIRDAAQKLGLNVTAGINTGEVYVGGVGSERHQEVTVMGSVVNLAARLQGKAEPGQILAGEATYRHTRRAFEFSPLSLEIKGLDHPVAAYAVVRALPRPEKVRGIEGLRADLIGRDDELAKLKEALAETQRGRGQMVSLIGEAGVGKSRLVSELKSGCWVSGAGCREEPVSASPVPAEPSTPSAPTPDTRHPTPLWLEGRCLELGMTASYWLFVDLFREYFGFAPEEDDRARGERIAAALHQLAAQGDLREDQVAEMGPLLGNLLAARFGNDWDDRLQNASPEQIKHQTFLAIRDFLGTLARRRPVVLALEDLHWADSLSLDVISLLMETLTRDPLLLLCVYRPEREHKCWRLGSIAAEKCAGRYTEILLRELTPQQSRRLVESLLAIDNLPASVKELILEKSHGNPFFVEEVVRSLIDSGMVYWEPAAGHDVGAVREPPLLRSSAGEGGSRAAPARLPRAPGPGVWRAREGIETVAVPESVQSVILSRVDRLERHLKGVLESASVIGRLFRRRLLEYTTEEAAELERALWELEDRQLIYQERVLPEEEYSFKHVLTQETIYESILRRRRAVFHQRVAEAMEALYRDGLDEYYEQLAYHYEQGSPLPPLVRGSGVGADEKAVEYLLKAGEKSRRAYLNDAAIGYFRRALERLEASALNDSRKGWRLEALRGLARTYCVTGEEAEAEDCYRRAIALAKEIGLPARELVRLYFWLSETLFWQSKFDEIARIGEEGLALLGDETESLEAALMNSRVAVGSLHIREKWREYTHRNAQFLQRLPYVEELRAPYVHIIDVWIEEKNVAEAQKWIDALEQNAKEHHDAMALVEVHTYRAVILERSGDFHGAIARRSEALDLCEKIGDTTLASWSLGAIGWACLSLGHLPQAEESRGRAVALSERMGMKRDVAGSHLSLGTIHLCKHDWAKAAAAYQTAIQLYQELGRGERAAQATYLLGRAYLAQGEREGARQRFHEALARVESRALTPGAPFADTFAALSGLEEVYGDTERFRAFCHRFQEEHPETAGASLVQWFLEPADVGTLREPPRLRDNFAEALAPGWTWKDLFGDCSFAVRNGLEIHAANGRDLWHLNVSAPRLLRPASGDLAVQTVAAPISQESPAIGGLLLWKDEANFLRLERGTKGRHEISFEACLGDEHCQIGRGRLVSERLFLRLERFGTRVNALCSADGRQWFTVGHVEFPIEGPLEVGVHALGTIDRTIYHDAYPDGTAIRFESFDMWEVG